MQDLSREERLQKRIAELERQIFEKDYTFDKEQWKRCKRTFFVLCGVIYFVLFYIALESDISISSISISSINLKSIEDIFYVLVALTLGVGFFAGIIMFISYAVMSYIIDGATKRVATIAKLKTELDTIKYFDIWYK